MDNHKKEDEEDRKPTAAEMKDHESPGGSGSGHHEDADGSKSPGSSSRRAKPALKKPHKKQSQTINSEAVDKKHLKWDEEAIEEHDQLRGTRMKIDEPNTPYTHYDSGAESDDSRRAKSPAHQKPTLSWDVLQTRLDSVAAVQEAYPQVHPDGGEYASEGTDADHSDVERERKSEMSILEFKEHRKRHYNEMEVVRRFRQEHPEESDIDVPDLNGDADAEN